MVRRCILSKQRCGFPSLNGYALERVSESISRRGDREVDVCIDLLVVVYVGGDGVVGGGVGVLDAGCGNGGDVLSAASVSCCR